MTVILELKVIPNSGKTLCTLHKNKGIVCYLKSSPERGLANKELVAYIAKTLSIPQQQIRIVQGLTSRKKRLQIQTDMNHDQLLYALGIPPQQNLW
jgi:uncharacterized protein YggU (UPF0235/DUF167 family)